MVKAAADAQGRSGALRHRAPDDTHGRITVSPRGDTGRGSLGASRCASFLAGSTAREVDDGRNQVFGFTASGVPRLLALPLLGVERCGYLPGLLDWPADGAGCGAFVPGVRPGVGRGREVLQRLVQKVSGGARSRIGS